MVTTNHGRTQGTQPRSAGHRPNPDERSGVPESEILRLADDGGPHAMRRPRHSSHREEVLELSRFDDDGGAQSVSRVAGSVGRHTLEYYCALEDSHGVTLGTKSGSCRGPDETEGDLLRFADDGGLGIRELKIPGVKKAAARKS